MTFTLEDLEAETDRYLKVWGQTQHAGTDLRGLIGRSLRIFVRETLCLFSTQLSKASVSSSPLNLETATFTKGSDTVEVFDAREVRLSTDSDNLLQGDWQGMRGVDFTTTGTPSEWCKGGEKELYLIPAPASAVALKVCGFHYHPEITSASLDDDEVSLPDECMDAFVRFVAVKRAETVADGAIGQVYQVRKAEVEADMQRLRGRYITQPDHLGRVTERPRRVRLGLR